MSIGFFPQKTKVRNIVHQYNYHVLVTVITKGNLYSTE